MPEPHAYVPGAADRCDAPDGDGGPCRRAEGADIHRAAADYVPAPVRRKAVKWEDMTGPQRAVTVVVLGGLGIVFLAGCFAAAAALLSLALG